MRNMQVIGNIGKITQKYTPSGKLITTASVATNSKVKGEKVTTWVNADFWEKSGEILQEYAHVGDKIYVAGSVNISTWKTDQGEARISIEITVKEFELLGRSAAPQSDQQPAAAGAAPDLAPEDDIPF